MQSDYMRVELAHERGEKKPITYCDEITGFLGEVFETDTSDIPGEAMQHLVVAYAICHSALMGK
jgi:hypothetical protein